MDILLLIGLIVLNGVFAMSEIALVTARKARLAKMAADGDGAASAALNIGEDPTRFLSTVQIGITSIGILNGIVGEAALAGPLSQWLQSLGVAPNLAGIGATTAVVALVTYVTIVVGELVPKRLGQLDPESIARLVARPMLALAALSRPFVLLLAVSTNTLLTLVGATRKERLAVTEEEIHAFLEEGSEAGVIEANEHAMVRKVLRLDERHLGSLMIPRIDVAYLDTRLPPEENLKRLVDSEHSRFPVCEGGLDKPLGLIHAKQVLAQIARGQAPDFTSDLQPCLYAPESLTGLDLLEQLQSNRVQLAMVVDEYGEIEGIVTLHDLLEAVMGEFISGDADDPWAIQREDGSWLLDGAIPILEMKDRLALQALPEEERGRYHTLSGMLLLLLGCIPETGDKTDWQGWDFEIVDMDRKRVDKVLATPRPRASQ